VGRPTWEWYSKSQAPRPRQNSNSRGVSKLEVGFTQSIDGARKTQNENIGYDAEGFPRDQGSRQPTGAPQGGGRTCQGRGGVTLPRGQEFASRERWTLTTCHWAAASYRSLSASILATGSYRKAQRPIPSPAPIRTSSSTGRLAGQAHGYGAGAGDRVAGRRKRRGRDR
jgi:hypothetical protein